jgi:hypothetical protein
MGRLGLVAFSALSALALLTFTAGCKTARTQIMVTTDTNLAVPGQIDAIVIEVSGPSGQMATADADLSALPAYFGVYHESGPLEPVLVRVVGRRGGADVIERSARLAFQLERTVVLPMNLLAACLTTSCGAGQTCGDNGCRNVEVGASELQDWTGSPPGVDAGGPTDGAVDSRVDTAVDTGVDTMPCVPIAERCNGMDDDCDDSVDEDFDLAGDLLNCGACGNVCALMNATPACTAGTCTIATCTDAFLDCDADPATGCEVDPGSDAAHCGACDAACGPGATCGGGTCACTPPLEMGATGCTDVMRDPLNCGAVDTVCAAREVCTSGVCVCRPGLVDAGADGCVDLATDPDNCGMVGNVCGGVCRDGLCQMACGPRTRCGDACTTLADDVSNCGSCGNACTVTEVCVSGACRDFTIGLTCTMCPCTACTATDTCCGYPAAEDIVCVDGPCP